MALVMEISFVWWAKLRSHSCLHLRPETDQISETFRSVCTNTWWTKSRNSATAWVKETLPTLFSIIAFYFFYISFGGLWMPSFYCQIDIWYDILVNCSWVDTWWQQYSTHLHTNSTQNNTKLTIHRTAQQFWESAGRAPPWLVIPWHLPYNWGKSTEKLQSG